jgi:hypothetical protein
MTEPTVPSAAAPPPPPKKKSTVRHTRAIQRDRSKRPTVAPPAAEIQARLAEVVQPAVYAQVAAYQAMGLRHRLLTLPVMGAFVLSLLWRHLGSVAEAVRVLQQEGVLWTPPLDVSPQAVNQRLRTLPPALFAGVLADVLPQMRARWQARTRAGERPLPPVLARARQHFTAILAVDGSTLDALLRKVGLLREGEGPVLAGRMAALLEVASCLPRQVWYEADSRAHDQRFWGAILAALAPGTLLLFDLGFLNYPRFDELTDRDVRFVTRVKTNTAYRVERTLAWAADRFEQLVWLGSGSTRCAHLLRLVGVRRGGPGGPWQRYLTNVLDPQALSLEDVVALYGLRWRMEDAFTLVKRLLGLAYFYAGAVNAVQTQLWMTWLLYAVLVDLTDAVAAALRRPYAAVSLEMVYRGLYHFTQAAHRGPAADPVAYLAARAKALGLLKRPRRRPSDQFGHLTPAQGP